MKKFTTYLFLLGITLTINFSLYADGKIIPVCQSRGNIFLPSSEKSNMYGKEDGTIVCWIDERYNGSLFIQKIDLYGNAVWNDNGTKADNDLGRGFTPDSDYPQLFSDNEGGAVIIYRKVFFDHEGFFLQKVYANGEHLSSPECLSAFFGGYNYSPSAVLNKNNEIIVTWENFTNGNFDIHAQKVDMKGNKLWSSGNEIVICDNAYDQRKPVVACTDNNMIFVSWLDSRYHASNYSFDLFATKLDDSGNRIENKDNGKLIFRNPYQTNLRKAIFYNHNIIPSEKNSYFVALENSDDNSFSRVYLLKLKENLDVQWTLDFPSGTFQSHPLIIPADNYGADVLWNDMNGISGIVADQNGNILWGKKIGGKVTCDIVKNSENIGLPSERNQNGICKYKNKFFSTWVTATSNKLFLTNIDLADESNQCGNTSEIQNEMHEGEFTSITALRNNIVIVFKQENNIYACIREVKEISPAIDRQTILRNFPNPFNPATTISFSIPSDGFVRLSVYNVNGKLINNLISEYKPAGNYNVNFDASSLSTGVYFYRLEHAGHIYTKRLLLLK